MKYGYYADDDLPKNSNIGVFSNMCEYKLNSYGYRCPEFQPLPNGKKNVVVLGCSHTFGVGLNEDEVWVRKISSMTDQNKLRWWNLGNPGSSAENIVRILYASEKVLFPNIIVVCWPEWSRRERLDFYHQNIFSNNPLLKTENENTDRNNFLKSVFFIEKFAEKTNAKTFHCFAQDVYESNNNNLQVLKNYTIKNCWPEWDRHHLPEAKREHITTTSLARDGVHYGAEHHETFARKFYERFKSKLR